MPARPGGPLAASSSNRNFSFSIKTTTTKTLTAIDRLLLAKALFAWILCGLLLPIYSTFSHLNEKPQGGEFLLYKATKTDLCAVKKIDK